MLKAARGVPIFEVPVRVWSSAPWLDFILSFIYQKRNIPFSYYNMLVKFAINKCMNDLERMKQLAGLDEDSSDVSSDDAVDEIDESKDRFKKELSKMLRLSGIPGN